MLRRRWGGVAVLLALTAGVVVQAQQPASRTSPPANGDVASVERVLAARKEYQQSLERLRAYYLSVGDPARARWAEDELIQYHRIIKQAYRLDLDVPPEKLPPAYAIPEANELYRQAMQYKDHSWGSEYVDNQIRAELLLQEILTHHPESDRRSDAAYQLGDLYEGKVFKQPQRAVLYFERCFEWNPTTQLDARLRAARLYEKTLMERTRAIELYREVVARETDQRRVQEAQKRLLELTGGR
jgi:hypothetical protein